MNIDDKSRALMRRHMGILKLVAAVSALLVFLVLAPVV